MSAKFYLFFVLIISGAAVEGRGQVTYNKRAGGPIGEAPKVGNFSNDYSLDNVDRSTGTVNISIPLYEVRAHDITVPVSISYSTLGLKVGQEAGAPGMGWELDAGGKIIRQINGLDDENLSYSSIKSTSPFTLDPDNNSTDRGKLMEVMNDHWDYAYDTYSYTLPGSGGRFTKNGLTFPYDPTFKYTDQAGRTITTGDGLVHHFTNGDRIIVRKRRFYRQKYSGSADLEEIPGGDWNTDPREYDSDYNLSMITSAKTRDTVKFEYQDTVSINPAAGIIDKDRFTTTETLPLSRKLMYMANNTWGDVDGQFYFMGEPVIGQSKIETKKHSRIRRITWATGKVEFDYNPVDVLGRDVLKQITIYQKTGGVYKWFKYYQFNYDPDVQYGHYLAYIEVFDAGGTKAAKWKFTYYGGDPYSGALGMLPVPPNIESKAKDRWGFYNGQTGNKTLIENPDSMINLRDIPHLRACIDGHPGSAALSFNYHRSEAKEVYNDPFDHISSSVGFANRSTNFNQMVLGTLSSVTTPTGERIDYQYEPHKYQIYGTSPADYSNYTKVYIGGGIRIKSILRRDGAAFMGQTLSERSFTYGIATVANPNNNTEAGYGLVNIPGVITSSDCSYVYNTSVTHVENLQCLSHPLNDLVLYNGSFAYYPSVTESVHKGPYTIHQTTYYFSFGTDSGPWNYPTPTSLVQLGFPEFYTNQGIKPDNALGKALQIIEYNGLRTDNTRVRVTKNTYSNFQAPATSPKLYSFFGGVKGTKIGEYNTSFTVCGTVSVNGNFRFECTQVGTIPNMDPLGYRDAALEIANNYYPGKYYGSTLELSALSNVYKLTGTTTSTWNTIYVDSLVNTTRTYYDNPAHLQPTLINNFSSNGDTTATRLKYAHDFLQNTVTGVDLLRGANIVAEPVENLSMVKKNGTYQILAGTLNTYMSTWGLVLNSSTYRFNTEGKLTPAGNSTELDSRYKLESNYEAYDEMGNPTLYSNLNGPKTALVWGYNQQYPIAEVLNAPSTNDVAFANFESDNKPALKGYWTYSGIPVTDDSSPSGDHVYSLSSGAISKNNNSVGKKYIVAYWYKTGSSVGVSGGTVGAENIKNTKGNWIYAEREVTVSATTTVSGSGFIDELRFFPADAMVRTFTYSPGIGITGMLDARGQSASYDYDNEQRVRSIRDQNGNIVKAYDYNIGKTYRQ